MGRIAPRKQVSPPWDYQRLLRAIHRFIPRAPLTSDVKSSHSPTFSVAALACAFSNAISTLGNLLKRVWHHPDEYRWMEPLPSFHRRGF